MSTRKHDLVPDSQGRYRPRVGWCVSQGNRSQPRFNLGTDKTQAEERLRRIQALYVDSCHRSLDSTWDEQGLIFARQLATGRLTVELPPETIPYEPSVAERLGQIAIQERDHSLDYAQVLESVQRDYRSVVVVPSDREHYGRSLAKNHALITNGLAKLESDLWCMSVPFHNNRFPTELATGTLHKALDVFCDSIRRDGAKLESGELVPYQRKRLEQVKRLKHLHPDIPLSSLTYDKCKEIVAFWRNRPKTKRGTPSSPSDVKNHLGQWMRFLRWLDVTECFQWTMPRGVTTLSCKATKLPSDRREVIITKHTYTPEQLSIINQHARPLERLCLYLGINCAMGAAELGRVEANDFSFSACHPDAQKLGFISDPSDSFLTRFRPKTDVFGQWLLWPDVARMAQWAIKRSERLGTKFLFVWETGKPMYDEQMENPQSGFANHWNRLLTRVKKSHPNFPQLPFGSLRDTLPNILRQRYTDDIASLCLAHGSPCKTDHLLECYANKPFGRLHTAIRELGAIYLPIFAATTSPLDETKHYLPIAVKGKIRAMLAEKKGASEIAQECKVSAMTVHRERNLLKKSEAHENQPG